MSKITQHSSIMIEHGISNSSSPHLRINTYHGHHRRTRTQINRGTNLRTRTRYRHQLKSRLLNRITPLFTYLIVTHRSNRAVGISSNLRLTRYITDHR
jgi:hypothetical protein